MQRFANTYWNGSGVYRHFLETICPPLKKVSETTRKTKNKQTALFLFICSLFVTALVYSYYINFLVAVTGSISPKPILKSRQSSREYSEHSKTTRPKKNRIHYSLTCNTTNQTKRLKCPKNLSLVDHEPQSSSKTCPDYFRWIHEDLRPWKETGITREMVESARRTANFRLVIVNGKPFVEMYKKPFQTRHVFTLWGILQLLKLYPKKLPDLDLMFDCNDRPAIIKGYYIGPNATVPPPLFSYCADDATLDIVFPDWSFWGWPEINIKPWDFLLEEIRQGNGKVKWTKREPYAYWKGNPRVAWTRKDLLKCNVSEKQDWNARLYAQDWLAEIEKGYKQSNLADQCIHRYKIYIEGKGWSVSEKYILTCDSVTLIVRPRYYDMFTRGLVPMQHYWPIKDYDKCRSIKFAVEWGNSHKKKAKEIGKAASNFIYKNLTMEYVYDYMFHLLSEYAKLLKYQPNKPRKAIEFCSETMACTASGLVRKFMEDTMVRTPRDTIPCNLPSPMDPLTWLTVNKKKEDSVKQVEMWEKEYWDDLTK